MIVTPHPGLKLLRSVKGGADLAAQFFLDPRQTLEKLAVAESFGDDHHVDVAGCRISALGDRAIDEGVSNRIDVVGQRLPQNVRKAEGLQAYRSDLLKNWRITVRLIVFLPADDLHRNNPGSRHLLQFALQGTPPGIDQLGNLVRIEGVVRAPEQQPEHPLPHTGEQDV